ncbi:plastocyanin/azurin family copper-binding protein, partial [Pseudomonas lactis]
VLVEPGKTAELTWTFKQATGLEFACNLPGHYQAGMVGKLTVE